MKRLRYAAFLLMFTLIQFACKNDKAGSLAIHIKPLYDGDSLITFVTKPFENGEHLQMSHLSTMISDLRLYDGADEQYLHDIELVDISFDNLQDAEEGFIMIINQVPASTYDGIRFGIGLTPDANAKNPSDFPSSNPLSKTSDYCSIKNSYIFMKTEGYLDTLGNGTFDLGFALHGRGNDAYRTFDWQIPILIEDGKQTDLNILIDYKRLIQGLDIKGTPLFHNAGGTLQHGKLIDNLVNNTVITLSL